MRTTTQLLLIACVGLYPAIVLGAPGLPAVPEVELEQAVHFQSSHGGDVLVSPGIYQVTATKEALRLIPHASSEGHTDSVLIQANPSVHELELGTPELLSIVGEDGTTHHLVYLMPGGEAREAIGFYSAVRTRAATSLWSKKINRPQVYRQYTSISALQARVGSSVRNTTQLSAQMAKLQAKMAELQKAIYDGQIDSAKVQYEEAKEQFKLALRLLQEHQERQSQAANKLSQ